MKKKSLLLLCIAILCLVGIVSIAWYRHSASKNSSTEPVDELATTLAQVGKVVDLPKDETPTLATISDKEALPPEFLFKNAQNGDMVLVYTEAKKAYLYRPSTNKVVEITSINLGGGDATFTTLGASASASAQPQPTQTPAPKAPPKVAILNGTRRNGLAKQAQSSIQTKVEGITITSATNANRQTYATSIVADTNGIYSDVASVLAEILSGSVESFPTTESKPPDADIIIILGANAAF